MPQPEPTSPRPGILKTESVECASPSSLLGVQQAASPKATPKTVSIAPFAETISPLVLGKEKNVDDFQLESDRSLRRPVKSVSSHRLTGRPPITSFPGSKSSLDLDSTVPDQRSSDVPHYSSKQLENLIDQVSVWIKQEKSKRARRKAKRHARKHGSAPPEETINEDVDEDEDPEALPRRGSEASEGSINLDSLENIVKQSLHIGSSRSNVGSLRKKLSSRKLHSRKPSTASSDTDYVDGDALVPSSDAVLDNSKTLAYTGGNADALDDSDAPELARVASHKDIDAWAKFKFEIVRLTHTLRLKGWRRVPMDASDDIAVERLSGALTNAVYVVSPPQELASYTAHRASIDSNAPLSKRMPPKLLLRIYGPQVEHLIDRDAELQILRRLARKRIGPRLLGTFANGRFEEYFHAQPLTPEELRDMDVSKQIAKRMRELHDGIELLDQERDEGAFVWRNWDKWVPRVEQVVSWLDEQFKSMPADAQLTASQAWMRRGVICGVEWKRFREVVDEYRAWLDAQYGGTDKIREHLVFAHNDTQYGNILRLVPSGESPLLLPANSHKQLIVIDFEYSNANLPGLEFANHFTEWCYNYHDKRRPYACNTKYYPTPEEQERFVRAYVRHRPQFEVSTPRLNPMSPAVTARTSSDQLKRANSSLSDFMLDARNPYFPSQASQSNLKLDDASDAAGEDAEVARLMHETRIWRMANTAQWVAWGIVQAKVPGLPDFEPATPAVESGSVLETGLQEALAEDADEYKELAREEQAQEINDDGSINGQEKEEQEEEFDYLGYAQHRAMFFWGDALQLGIVKEADLPDDLKAKVKTVPY